MKIDTVTRIKTVKIFLAVCGLFLLFWWPMAHWFYTDFYHQLLGFQPGSYQDSMVKQIGTCGMIPVLLCLLASKNPVRNRDAILALIVYSILQAFTYLYLILLGAFPVGEIFNIGLCVFCALFLIFVFPWKENARQYEGKSEKSS